VEASRAVISTSKICAKDILAVRCYRAGDARVILTWEGPALASDKYETIDAQTFGTGTQLGPNIGATLHIYEFSIPADRAVLVQAYETGQNHGLVNGSWPRRDYRYARERPCLYQDDSNTNGPADRVCDQSSDQFAEARADSQSQSFDLTPRSSISTIKTRVRAQACFTRWRRWWSTNKAHCNGI